VPALDALSVGDRKWLAGNAFALPLATLLGPVAISQVHERDFRPESLDESDAVIRILTNLITKSIAE
jgi:hypothetical protein